MSERTLAIIKPDSVQGGHIGPIISRLEQEGFAIRALKMVHLDTFQAEGFYHVHRERPFFGSLTRFMSEGPIVVLVLEAENAVRRLREVMGVTNPHEARNGTIRKQFGASIERNAIHGSDGSDTAAFEISCFFSRTEMV